jgi:glutamate-ammonia-ligase adenylyltransferase
VKHEQMFRIGAQVLSGSAAAADAGRAYADLADLCVQALAPAALTETVRIAGEFPGAVAVVGLGKFGGQEMTATSDLDLMVVYDAADPTAGSSIKGWSADTFFARFTQRLIAALSSPTSQGGLYEIDMRLRPSGSKGPVAVSLSAFERYYREEAETWELMALTRARVVWSAPEAFGAKAAGAVEAALRRPRSSRRVLVEVREMRALMETERPAAGPWDLKLTAGGFVDIEFAAQALQLSHAPEGGPIRSNTRAALAALAREAPDAGRLAEAFAMQHDLALVLGAALEGAPPVDEPAAFKNLLARAGGARTYPALVKRLAKVQAEAAAAARRVFGGVSTDFPTSDV